MRGGDIVGQGEMLAAVVEQMVPVQIGRGKYEVEIAWTPLGEGLQIALQGSEKDITPLVA